MPAKAPDINLENAIKAYLAGEAAQKVAPRFGICGKRLTRVLKERGLLRGKAERYALAGAKNGLFRHSLKNLPDQEIARRYRAGETELALAIAYGVTRSAIMTSLRLSGMPRRTFAEANILRSKQIPLKPRKAVFNDHPGPYLVSWEQRVVAAQRWQEKASTGKWARASAAEIALLELLRARGIAAISQQAVGPYNVDIGAFPIAVEVWGGNMAFQSGPYRAISLPAQSGLVGNRCLY